MKLADKRGLSGALEVVLWVAMAVGLAVTVTLPWSIRAVMMPFNPNPDYWYPRYVVCLMGSGVFAELILWQARCIMRNVNTGTIFSSDTVKRMKIAAGECLALSVFYLVMLLCGMTKFTMVVVCVTFLLAGLIVLVFSELFRQAVAYKQENDMTI